MIEPLLEPLLFSRYLFVNDAEQESRIIVGYGLTGSDLLAQRIEQSDNGHTLFACQSSRCILQVHIYLPWAKSCHRIPCRDWRHYTLRVLCQQIAMLLLFGGSHERT